MVTFKTTAELTNSNILNEANYGPYIANRFTTSSGSTLSLTSAEVVVTDLKMSETGLDGFTNSMISAIWGLDTLL